MYWSLLGLVPFGMVPFGLVPFGMVPFGLVPFGQIFGPFWLGPLWPVPFGRSLLVWSLSTPSLLKILITLLNISAVLPTYMADDFTHYILRETQTLTAVGYFKYILGQLIRFFLDILS